MKIWAVNSLTRDRSIFLLCSNRTEELGWISTFVSGFAISPCTKCWFSKFKMASPSWISTHQCTHAFTVQQFTRLCSHLASHAGLFRGARIWPLLKNACLTENNISHSFIRVVSDQSTVLSLTFIKAHKAFLVFHADRVHLWGYPAVKVNLPEFGTYNVIGSAWERNVVLGWAGVWGKGRNKSSPKNASMGG